MSNSGVKYGSGRKKFIGMGLAVPSQDLEEPYKLDPALYTGSVLYASDALLYYSDGAEWKQIVPPIIIRPTPIEATTPFERRQLRITPFVPGPGYQGLISWTKTIFYVSKNRDMSDSIRYEITDINSQTTLNIDGPPNDFSLELGDTFYWQAQYEGKFDADDAPTGPSDRSKVQQQVFPDNLIDQPYSVTLSGSETDRLLLSDFSSAFGYSYNILTSNTYFEIYDIDDVPGEDRAIYEATNRSNPGTISVVNIPGLNGDKTYLWRGLYSIQGLPNSAWSTASAFSPPYGNLVLYIDTTKVQPFNSGTKTFYVQLATTSSATIQWGDGTSNTITGDANSINIYQFRQHDYPVDGIYRVEIGGSVSRFGDIDTGTFFTGQQQSNAQSMIINCTSFGTSLGIVSLTSAFMNAKNLTDVTAYLPTTVTNLRRTFLNATSFNSPSVKQWDVSRVTDFGNLFNGCTLFNQDLSQWNTRAGQFFDSMFVNAVNFNGNITYWDTTNLLALSNIFNGAASFNKNLNRWDTSRVTNMESVFRNASIFNGNISTWNTGSVLNMASMFSGANSFNQNISTWNTSEVTSMSGMFINAKTFNQNINGWNVSKVINMQQMFDGASRFNQNLNLWNTVSANNMSYMFRNASTFNANVSTWNTSKVITMQQMFNGATRFNQNLDSWNTSNVINMQGWANNASSFNGNVSTWNTGNVVTMQEMFRNATVFNRSLNNWNTGNVTSMYLMFYDSLAFNQNLDSWNTSSVTNMQQMFSSSTGTPVFNGNISTWDTSKVTNVINMFDRALSFNQSLNNWNTGNVTSMSAMFNNAREFNQNLHSWDTSKVTNMNSMFRLAGKFNGNVSTWNTSNVTTMSNMFNSASVFNQDINNWNTSNVTIMTSMFQSAVKFNQNLYSWDTSKVTSMSTMFWVASEFNGNVSTWNVGNVTTMSAMFRSCGAFNRDLSNWNISNVTDTSLMFNAATTFNGNVSTWNTSNVTRMESMFSGATVFNGNVSSWNISKVIRFDSIFLNARAFNQDLSSWNLSTSSGLNMGNFLTGSNTSNTNFARLIISFANKTKNAPNFDNPKEVIFQNMADRFYSNTYSTAEFGDIQSGNVAVDYLFGGLGVISPVKWIKNTTDVRPGI